MAAIPDKGLLDHPELLEAMLTGKYAVQTATGRFIGAYDSDADAMNAVIHHTNTRLTITPPIAKNQLDSFQTKILAGLAKREAENRPLPEGIYRIKKLIEEKL